MKTSQRRYLARVHSAMKLLYDCQLRYDSELENRIFRNSVEIAKWNLANALNNRLIKHSAAYNRFVKTQKKQQRKQATEERKQAKKGAQA